MAASPDAKRLYDDLLRKSGYNKLIRPVGNNTDVLLVNLGLRLTQIIDVVSGAGGVYVLALSLLSGSDGDSSRCRNPVGERCRVVMEFVNAAKARN